jgi:hypothetical protein
MTEQNIRDAWRQSSQQQPLQDDEVEAKLAAALLGGDATAREAGLELLGRMPQGPQLARVMASLAPEAARLGQELAARRAQPARPVRRFGAVLALAASAAAVAVLVGGLRSGGPTEPAGVPLPADSESIMVASFEMDADAAPSGSAVAPIFRSDFDS